MTDQANPPSAPAQPGEYPEPTGEQSASEGNTSPATEPPASSKAAGFGKRILRTAAVFIVIALGGVAWAYITGSPETAKVGDCMTGESADELKTIDCTDPTAQHKVVGKVENKTEAEFNATDVETLCAGMPSIQSAYWQGEENGKGFVLCLGPVG